MKAQRIRLIQHAYRMLGVQVEAEDVVQEAYARLHQLDQPPNNADAWLTTVVTRLAIDVLKSARHQRVQYFGVWLPEPLTLAEVEQTDTAELAQTLTLAFMHMMEFLTPSERAVFLLREVFDYDYEKIADTLQKSESACRKLFSRARQQLSDQPLSDTAAFTQPATESDEALAWTQKFMATCQMGNFDQITEALADDILVLSDGGGKTQALVRPIMGRERVAHFILTTLKHIQPGFKVELTQYFGDPCLKVSDASGPISVIVFWIRDQKLQRLYAIRNPDKLALW